MKTDALIQALRAAGIESAVALRLFSMWLDSTATEMDAQMLDGRAEQLRDLAAHLHANAKALEAEADLEAHLIEKQNEDRR